MLKTIYLMPKINPDIDWSSKEFNYNLQIEIVRESYSNFLNIIKAVISKTESGLHIISNTNTSNLKKKGSKHVMIDASASNFINPYPQFRDTQLGQYPGYELLNDLNDLTNTNNNDNYHDNYHELGHENSNENGNEQEQGNEQGNVHSGAHFSKYPMRRKIIYQRGHSNLESYEEDEDPANCNYFY